MWYISHITIYHHACFITCCCCILCFGWISEIISCRCIEENCSSFKSINPSPLAQISHTFDFQTGSLSILVFSQYSNWSLAWMPAFQAGESGTTWCAKRQVKNDLGSCNIGAMSVPPTKWDLGMPYNLHERSVVGGIASAAANFFVSCSPPLNHRPFGAHLGTKRGTMNGTQLSAFWGTLRTERGVEPGSESVNPFTSYRRARRCERNMIQIIELEYLVTECMTHFSCKLDSMAGLSISQKLTLANKKNSKILTAPKKNNVKATPFGDPISNPLGIWDPTLTYKQPKYLETRRKHQRHKRRIICEIVFSDTQIQTTPGKKSCPPMCHVCVTAKRAHQLTIEAGAPNLPQALTPGFFLGGSRRILGSGGPKKSPKMAKKI